MRSTSYSKEEVINYIIDVFNRMHENRYNQDHPKPIVVEPIVNYNI